MIVFQPDKSKHIFRIIRDVYILEGSVISIKTVLLRLDPTVDCAFHVVIHIDRVLSGRTIDVLQLFMHYSLF